MVPLLSELLGLPGMDVEAYTVVEDGLILEVEAHSESACCPRCGTLSRHLHQNHWHLVSDLLISHYQKTWLRVNRRQFKCAVWPLREAPEKGRSNDGLSQTNLSGSC